MRVIYTLQREGREEPCKSCCAGTSQIRCRLTDWVRSVWLMAIIEHSACCTPVLKPLEVVGGLCGSLSSSLPFFLSSLGLKSKECQLSRLVGIVKNSWECCWFPQEAWSVESCSVPCIEATTPWRRAVGSFKQRNGAPRVKNGGAALSSTQFRRFKCSSVLRGGPFNGWKTGII